MEAGLLHIFKNTPAGRESFLQSLYFCRKTGASPIVYLPEFNKFLMYFEDEVMQVNLDDSWLLARETARKHAGDLLKKSGFEPDFLIPKNFTSATLPDIPTHFDFMTCPWNLREIFSSVTRRHAALRIRRMVNAAYFPLLLCSPAYKEWNSITVFFNGSIHCVNALKLGIHIQKYTGVQMDIFTQAGGKALLAYEEVLRKAKLETETKQAAGRWQFFESGLLEENLYEIPHDALVILGGSGNSLIHDMICGSFPEKLQILIANPMLIAGPKYAVSE
ncbi:MAG: universal stress protein [Desulfobacterales bacterium]